MKTIFKVILTCLPALICLASCKKDLNQRSETDNIIETKPAIHKNVSTNIIDNCAGYFEALPTRYDSSLKKYPLIFFIHGIGELGNGGSDLVNMTRAGLPRLINKKAFPPDFNIDGQHFSFVVLAPQFKKWPSNAEVNSVLQYFIKNYRVDTSRVYVTGLSMGGGVSWEFSSVYGNSIAAMAPICGGSWPDPKRAEKIAAAGLPVWAFHNEDDKTVPVSYSRDYVNRINGFHPQVTAKLTTWPTGGHDSWTKAYDPLTRQDGKNIYEWMLSFSRKKSK